MSIKRAPPSHASLSRPSGEHPLRDRFGGYRIIQDAKLVDGPFEDWSQVRSHGRAARRRKRGFPQRIRIYYTPSTQALVMGDTIVCHPAMYADIAASCK